MNARFELRGVSLSYGGAPVLRQVSVRLDAPELVALAGPNGAGKSTLLSIMAGLRGSFQGDCLLDGRDVRAWTRPAFARRVSFVPQSLKLEFPFTAEEVVLMGRTPFGGGLFESPEDHAAVQSALEKTDTTRFRRRDFRSLSGGERQRVVLASALAQTPSVLLLDEPTTFLDLEHQVSIYSLLRDISRAGVLVIAATHDLNLASTYCDRLMVLSAGQLVADDVPGAVLRPELLRAVFRVEARVMPGAGGRPWVVYGD